MTENIKEREREKELNQQQTNRVSEWSELFAWNSRLLFDVLRTMKLFKDPTGNTLA